MQKNKIITFVKIKNGKPKTFQSRQILKPLFIMRKLNLTFASMLTMLILLISFAGFTACSNSENDELVNVQKAEKVKKDQSVNRISNEQFEEVLIYTKAVRSEDELSKVAVKDVQSIVETGKMMQGGGNFVLCHSDYNNPSGMALTSVTMMGQTHYRLIRWSTLGCCKYYSSYEISQNTNVDHTCTLLQYT